MGEFNRVSIKECYAIVHKWNGRVGIEVAHNYRQVADIHIVLYTALKNLLRRR